MKDENLYELKEKTVHGSTIFPFEIYFIQWFAGHPCMHYHWHDEIEFIYMLKGCAIFMIDGMKTELYEGQSLLIKSGSIHTRYQLIGSSCEYRAIVFSADILASRLPDACQNKYIQPFVSGHYCLPQLITGQSPWQSKVLDELKAIIDCFSKQEWGFELAIKASLFRIVSLILPNCKTTDKSYAQSTIETENIQLLKQIVKYIDDHYQEKVNLKDLSNAVNISQSHLCRLFKKLTNRTVVDYMNEYRIKQAVQLLQAKNRKVIDISQEVGFENVSYFIKIFKRVNGYTPVQYRVYITGEGDMAE